MNKDATPHPEETADVAALTEKEAEGEISQSLRRLSAKVEQIWNMLIHEEILPKEASEAKNQ